MSGGGEQIANHLAAYPRGSGWVRGLSFLVCKRETLYFSVKIRGDAAGMKSTLHRA